MPSLPLAVLEIVWESDIADMSTQNVSTIAELPSRDQRLHALAQTGLVRKWEVGDWWDGLTIRSGQIEPPGPHGWVTPFPFELLGSANNSDFTAEVWEILFSQNRIILQNDLNKCLAFLQNHSESVKHIKTLDIQFNQEDTIKHWGHGSSEMVWYQISNFIATKLSLDHLDLSLDAGPTYESYKEMGVDETDLHFLCDIYVDIVDTLVEALAGKTPKSFSLYLGAWFDMEAEGEVQVMRQIDYDSVELGKIPHTRRSAYFPHGAPTKELENPDGLEL